MIYITYFFVGDARQKFFFTVEKMELSYVQRTYSLLLRAMCRTGTQMYCSTQCDKYHLSFSYFIMIWWSAVCHNTPRAP
jgi:hypothetical protein